MRAALLALLAASADAYVMARQMASTPALALQRAPAVECKDVLRQPNKAARREMKLRTGANWPPRTDPTPGKGYFFFQGPSPKTAVQADLPSFFSAENFADLEFTPAQVAVTITGLASAAVLATTLLAPPSISAPTAAPPAVTKPKAEEKKAPA